MMMSTTVRLPAMAIAVCALIAPVVASADGAPFDQVTGGGQVVLSGADLEAAGDTIALQAQDAPGAPNKGNVQYVRTSLAGSDEVSRWNGTVTCLAVDGSTAQLGGTIRDAGGTQTGFFAIEVTDNGEPAEGAGVDLITITYPDGSPSCAGDFDETDELMLARGNVRVHDA